MKTDFALDRALEALQHMTDPEPPWADILESARRLFGCDGVAFLVFENERAVDVQQNPVDASTVDDYISYFNSHDIMLRRGAPRPAGTWLDTEALLPKAELLSNEYYVDFMCKHRMRHLLTYLAEETETSACSMTFQRESVSGSARQRLDDDAIVTYTLALQRTLALRKERASRALQSIQEAFDAFGEATCLATPTGLALQVSPAAAEQLSHRPSLQLRNGHLWHPQAAVRDALARALQFAAGTRQTISIAVPGEQGIADLIDLVRADARFSIGREPLVHVRLRRSPGLAAPTLEALCASFGITPAEARVLAALMQGQAPKQYAESRQLSVHTVRAQIASLKEKMGCSRQTDLVRAGLSLALP